MSDSERWAREAVRSLLLGKDNFIAPSGGLLVAPPYLQARISRGNKRLHDVWQHHIAEHRDGTVYVLSEPLPDDMDVDLSSFQGVRDTILKALEGHRVMVVEVVATRTEEGTRRPYIEQPVMVETVDLHIAKVRDEKQQILEEAHEKRLREARENSPIYQFDPELGF